MILEKMTNLLASHRGMLAHGRDLKALQQPRIHKEGESRRPTHSSQTRRISRRHRQNCITSNAGAVQECLSYSQPNGREFRGATAVQVTKVSDVIAKSRLPPPALLCFLPYAFPAFPSSIIFASIVFCASPARLIYLPRFPLLSAPISRSSTRPCTRASIPLTLPL